MPSDKPSDLLGIWHSDPEDRDSVELLGCVSMEFKADGQLIYTIHEPSRDRLMLMTWSASGGILTTNQPTHPSEERTAFRFTPDGKLQLRYGNHVSRYVRGDAEVQS